MSTRIVGDTTDGNRTWQTLSLISSPESVLALKSTRP
jgi:hypothetical protein